MGKNICVASKSYTLHEIIFHNAVKYFITECKVMVPNDPIMLMNQDLLAATLVNQRMLAGKKRCYFRSILNL